MIVLHILCSKLFRALRIQSYQFAIKRGNSGNTDKGPFRGCPRSGHATMYGWDRELLLKNYSLMCSNQLHFSITISTVVVVHIIAKRKIYILHFLLSLFTNATDCGMRILIIINSSIQPYTVYVYLCINLYCIYFNM